MNVTKYRENGGSGREGLTEKTAFGKTGIVIHEITGFFCGGSADNAGRSGSYRLIYVRGEESGYVVDGAEYILKRGELMLVFPWQRYGCENCGGMSDDIHILFNMTLTGGEKLRNRVFKDDLKIRFALMNALAEYKCCCAHFTDAAAICLQQIILHLMRCAGEDGEVQSGSERKNAGTSRLVNEAMDYIDAHISDKLSLSDVAEAMRLNPSYISRLFAERAGMCITEYIRVRKLDAAVNALETGRYTVTEISEMLAFSSIHYFSKCFKKEFGVAPTEFVQKR